MERFFSILRSFLFVLFVFPTMTFLFSVIGILGYVFTRKRDLVDTCANLWAKITLFFVNAKLEVRGFENIPTHEGSLLLFNHTSFFDIFILLAVVKSLRFGAKIELYSIPIFSLAMRAAGNLPITRKNRENAIRVLKDAEDRARMGERFALAPEGGRNFEEKLLPFKSGPFIFAIQSGIPVVPVIIKGAMGAWPKHSLFPGADSWRNPMSVEFLPAVSTAGYNLENRSELMDKVRNQMLQFF